MTTPTNSQPLRSRIACRYLELLAAQRRNSANDIEEYCRQFELCSAVVSKTHVKKLTLADLFLNGLPGGRIANKRLMQFEGPTVDSVDLVATINAARVELVGIPGTSPLVKANDSASIDRLLFRSLEIKSHPEANFEAKAKFDRFMEMLNTLNDKQLANAVQGIKTYRTSPFLSMTGAESTEPDQVLYTPATTVSEAATETGRKLLDTSTSPAIIEALVLRLSGSLVQDMMKEVAKFTDPSWTEGKLMTGQTKAVCEQVVARMGLALGFSKDNEQSAEP